MLSIEFNNELNDQNYPNIIIHSIDNNKTYVFPKIHKITKNKIVYLYKDKLINNLIIDDHLQMNLIYNNPELDVHKISYRSI
jgi:hypothetical protein